MMRQAFLFLSTQKGMRKWMETSPVARSMTRRFIAGLTLEDELAVCADLAAKKTFATLDHLGENVKSLAEAEASRDAYLTALDEIAKRGLPATVSIKLTQFGLDLSNDACFENVHALAERATANGTRIEIDMESTAYTDRTLAIVEKIGSARAVIQAYLYRRAADIARLNELKIPVRLCKGAYNEPATAAFPGKADVDRSFLKLMKLLLDKGTYPAIASHDETILGEAFRYARERKIAPENFEFQMLYGIRTDLQQRIIDLGYRLRVYVPYGEAWYPYFMRRLAERPANVLFLAKNFFKGS
jgi:proline dehydrogenase